MEGHHAGFPRHVASPTLLTAWRHRREDHGALGGHSEDRVSQQKAQPTPVGKVPSDVREGDS